MPMKSDEASTRVTIVSDPEKIKILVDPMRRKILRTMREGKETDEGTIRKEMTVPEIAQKLGVAAPKCYHHVDLLLEHGFVKVAREEMKKRSKITFYERTSPAFVLASTIDEIERKEGIRTDPLISFISDGYRLNLSEKQKEEAQKLMDDLGSRRHDIMVKVAQDLKGNIPEDKLRDVINFVSNQKASNDPKCLEIHKELEKYIKLDI